MKKKFIVEIEYESINGDVLYGTGLEIAIEDFMEGYVSAESIENGFNVNVKEVLGRCLDAEIAQ